MNSPKLQTESSSAPVLQVLGGTLLALHCLLARRTSPGGGTAPPSQASP
jgi:hypothetical protein